MTYQFSTTVDLPFADAVTVTTDVLKKYGFGVLTEIDVQATLKTKLGVDFRPYRRHRQLGGSPACEMRLSQVGGRDDNVRCSQLRRLPLPG